MHVQLSQQQQQQQQPQQLQQRLGHDSKGREASLWWNDWENGGATPQDSLSGTILKGKRKKTVMTDLGQSNDAITVGKYTLEDTARLQCSLLQWIGNMGLLHSLRPRPKDLSSLVFHLQDGVLLARIVERGLHESPILGLFQNPKIRATRVANVTKCMTRLLKHNRMCRYHLDHPDAVVSGRIDECALLLEDIHRCANSIAPRKYKYPLPGDRPFLVNISPHFHYCSTHTNENENKNKNENKNEKTFENDNENNNILRVSFYDEKDDTQSIEQETDIFPSDLDGTLGSSGCLGTCPASVTDPEPKSIAHDATFFNAKPLSKMPVPHRVRHVLVTNIEKQRRQKLRDCDCYPPPKKTSPFQRMQLSRGHGTSHSAHATLSHWLGVLGFLVPKESFWEPQIYEFCDGVLLCELVEKLNRSAISVSGRTSLSRSLSLSLSLLLLFFVVVVL